jgi:hypothetical protein
MACRGRLKVKLLNMMLKVEFKKIKMAYGLIRNIKGYHIRFFRLLTYPLKDVMTVIQLGGTLHGMA